LFRGVGLFERCQAGWPTWVYDRELQRHPNAG
jgi:hypothetical protein